MKCFDPVLCFIREKKTIYRNWSFVKLSPLLMGVKPSMVFNCGKCLLCRKRRALELSARCVLHASLYKHNMFLTLTYDEKKEGYHNVFDYKDIQLFKKRLRQHVWRSKGDRIEVFNVHEYGKNGKKHWHLIVFGFCFPDREVFSYSDGRPLFTSCELSEQWPAGFSTIGDVSEASAMYQAQYMEKDFSNGNTANSRKSHSKHSGLGKPYFIEHYRQILSLGFIPFSGRKLPVPRYFQKLAHKHFCHFHDQSKFYDTRERKQVYRPFKEGEASRDISDHYELFTAMKQERILELEKEFEETVLVYLAERDVPDFVKSGSNAEYDFLNRNTIERF